MYISHKTMKFLKAIEEAFISHSNIVDSWSEKYGIKKEDLSLIWRAAELRALKSKNCLCIPWQIATLIFEKSCKKHFGISKNANKKSSKKELSKKEKEHYQTVINQLKKLCSGTQKNPRSCK